MHKRAHEHTKRYWKKCNAGLRTSKSIFSTSQKNFYINISLFENRA